MSAPALPTVFSGADGPSPTPPGPWKLASSHPDSKAPDSPGDPGFGPQLALNRPEASILTQMTEHKTLCFPESEVASVLAPAVESLIARGVLVRWTVKRSVYPLDEQPKQRVVDGQEAVYLGREDVPAMLPPPVAPRGSWLVLKPWGAQRLGRRLTTHVHAEPVRTARRKSREQIRRQRKRQKNPHRYSFRDQKRWVEAGRWMTGPAAEALERQRKPLRLWNTIKPIRLTHTDSEETRQALYRLQMLGWLDTSTVKKESTRALIVDPAALIAGPNEPVDPDWIRPVRLLPDREGQAPEDTTELRRNENRNTDAAFAWTGATYADDRDDPWPANPVQRPLRADPIRFAERHHLKPQRKPTTWRPDPKLDPRYAPRLVWSTHLPLVWIETPDGGQVRFLRGKKIKGRKDAPWTMPVPSDSPLNLVVDCRRALLDEIAASRRAFEDQMDHVQCQIDDALRRKHSVI
jgi:hypothetical protein